MKSFLFGLFILCACQLCAQDRQNSARLSAGLGNFVVQEPLINTYQYSGVSPGFAQLELNRKKTKSQFQMALSAYLGEGDPRSFNSLLYDYNRLELNAYSCKINYLRSVPLSISNIELNLGVAYKGGYYGLTQKYKNRLYEAAEGSRESYLLNAAGIGLGWNLSYGFGEKHKLCIQGQYGLISYAARPDDNYIKQLALDSKPKWGWYMGKEYVSYEVAITYEYWFSSVFGISLALETAYQYYHVDDSYVQRMNCAKIGIERRF